MKRKEIKVIGGGRINQTKEQTERRLGHHIRRRDYFTETIREERKAGEPTKGLKRFRDEANKQIRYLRSKLAGWK